MKGAKEKTTENKVSGWSEGLVVRHEKAWRQSIN